MGRARNAGGMLGVCRAVSMPKGRGGEGETERATGAEGIASVRERPSVRVRALRAREGGCGVWARASELDLRLLAHRAARTGSRPRGAQSAGRGRRPPPRQALHSAARWACAGRCAIPGSCGRAQRPVGPSWGQGLRRHTCRVVKGHGATQNGSSERSSLAEAPPLLPSLDRNSRSSLFCAYTAALHLPAKRRKGAQLPRPIPLHPPRISKFARLPATVPVMRKSFN